MSRRSIILQYKGDVKMLRETLCVAQSLIAESDEVYRKDWHLSRLQQLIDECDFLRPLGPGGKHGDLHTPFCGVMTMYGHFRKRFRQ